MKLLRRLVISAAVAAGMLLLLHSPYEKYMDNYYAETCRKARFYTTNMYSEELSERKDKKDGLSEEGMASFLKDFVENTYRRDVSETLTCEGLCRGGGTVTFRIDPEDLTLHSECSLHGE